MKIKILSALLMIAGVILFSYPKVAEMVEDARQQKLEKDWIASFQNVESVSESAPVSPDSDEIGTAENSPEGAAEFMKSYAGAGKVEGILVIDKIGLRLPILEGATNRNLKTTAASIEHTGTAGEIGNYAIAGHRNRTFGRNFNRLDELEAGDQLKVDTGEASYQYTVTEKTLVKPEDVWVLEGDGSSKEITLVTCHPIDNPTHRLIVKGRIIP
ncbi:class D sortase [Paenibacillus lutrae]|nr:class D sortase [Paenibacillus lutrae]